MVYFERNNEEKRRCQRKNSIDIRGEKRTKNVITSHVPHGEGRTKKGRKKRKQCDSQSHCLSHDERKKKAITPRGILTIGKIRTSVIHHLSHFPHLVSMKREIDWIYFTTSYVL